MAIMGQSQQLYNRLVKVLCKDEGSCHTAKGTACAIPTMIMAIMESNLLHNGLVKVPDVLVDFMLDKAEEIQTRRSKNKRPNV